MKQQNKPVSAGDPKFKPSSIRFQICTKTTCISIFIGTFGSVDAFERKKRCLWRADVLSFNPSSCLGKPGFFSQQDMKVFRNVSSLRGRPYSCDYWIKRYRFMIEKCFEILK